MQGIPFRVDGQGRVLISWMSRDKAYWAISAEKAGPFGSPVATPGAGTQAESFPMVLANRKGEVLLTWKAGKRIQWALYTMDGKYTGNLGQGGELPWRNKHTAFVGADDNFYVVF
jgi:hypothetical protein